MSCKHTIGTAVDEDGCCVSCGADLNPIAMAETPSPIHKWLKEDAVRYDLTTEEIIQQLCEENEAYQAELAEARKKPEPTDEGCTNCKNLLEAEITRQAAELAQLKRALRYPEPDDSERQYMFCGYCGKEGAMTIDELQQHILSCEKHPIFKLQAELEAKDKEIDRLKRVIELDEQIEQALKK